MDKKFEEKTISVSDVIRNAVNMNVNGNKRKIMELISLITTLSIDEVKVLIRLENERANKACTLLRKEKDVGCLIWRFIYPGYVEFFGEEICADGKKSKPATFFVYNDGTVLGGKKDESANSFNMNLVKTDDGQKEEKNIDEETPFLDLSVKNGIDGKTHSYRFDSYNELIEEWYADNPNLPGNDDVVENVMVNGKEIEDCCEKELEYVIGYAMKQLGKEVTGTSGERLHLVCAHKDGKSVFSHVYRVGENTDVRDAMAAACNEYAKTEEGKKEIRENGGDFNYSRFAQCVPEQIREKHGLKKVVCNVSVFDESEPFCTVYAPPADEEFLAKVVYQLGLPGEGEYVKQNFGAAVDVYMHGGSIHDLDNIVQLEKLLGFHVTYEILEKIGEKYDGEENESLTEILNGKPDEDFVRDVKKIIYRM